MKEIILLILFLLPTIAFAIDFNAQISDSDKASFDKMLEPVVKVYTLFKYAVSVIAVIILSIAGVTYMISGSDPKKRDTAKSMATYVIIGLIIIWVAPFVVDFMIGG
jgi:type IV secretory pathway VirB2 component (pilin)